jgi:hypothetical protein
MHLRGKRTDTAQCCVLLLLCKCVLMNWNKSPLPTVCAFRGVRYVSPSLHRHRRNGAAEKPSQAPTHASTSAPGSKLHGKVHVEVRVEDIQQCDDMLVPHTPHYFDFGPQQIQVWVSEMPAKLFLVDDLDSTRPPGASTSTKQSGEQWSGATRWRTLQKSRQLP